MQGDEVPALYEQALMEQDEAERMQVRSALDRLWEKYKDQIPWEDAENNG